MSRSILVAEALVQKRFLSGRYAIQYFIDVEKFEKTADYYYLRQVSIAIPEKGKWHDGCLSPLYVGRHRTFNSKAMDSWPTWRPIRGSSCSTHGFGGLWLPHVGDLMAEAEFVRLKDGDRVQDVLNSKEFQVQEQNIAEWKRRGH
jgi:hypothetical protein